MTEDDLRRFIEGKNAGAIHYIEGPNQIGGNEYWHVWTHKNGEFHTRYIIDQKLGTPLYFDAFPSFAIHLDGRLMEAQGRRFTNYIAATVFLLATAEAKFDRRAGHCI